MTESKRFDFKDTIYNEVFLKKKIYDNYTNKTYGGILKDQDDLCKLLNELNDENKELKADNNRMVKFIMSKGYSLKDYLEWLNTEVWV